MKTNLVFLGDSITAGVIAGPELDYRKNGYAKYVRDYFALNDSLGTYHNFAVSGFMTSDLLRQFQTNITHNENIAFNILDEKCYRLTKKRVGHDTIKFTHPDISISEAIANADIVTMTCGANDLIRLFRKMNEASVSKVIRSLYTNQYSEDALENALKNYMIIMEYIIALNPKCEIILLANYFPSNDERLEKRLYEKFSKLEDALFDTVASHFPNNIKLYKPRFEFIENSKQYVTSKIDIHPSSKGHIALANMVLKTQTKIDYQDGDVNRLETIQKISKQIGHKKN